MPMMRSAPGHLRANDQAGRKLQDLDFQWKAGVIGQTSPSHGMALANFNADGLSPGCIGSDAHSCLLEAGALF